MADLNPPDFETRLAILKARCAAERIRMQDDVLEVEVDATAFPEESANMVEIARGHLRAGRERAAS